MENRNGNLFEISDGKCGVNNEGLVTVSVTDIALTGAGSGGVQQLLSVHAPQLLQHFQQRAPLWTCNDPDFLAAGAFLSLAGR